jgi:hypothetical protein
MATDRNEVANRFTFHPATGDKGAAHDHVRQAHLEIALRMTDMLPESREKSLCLTALQESMHWANAAIALHLPAH